MADHQSIEGSSTSDVSSGNPESTVELNIKTLDSRIYSFHADKNMPVSAFKEKIASQIGVPVEQQRLIFRGKVLKDDHLLSEYYVENGHTLHLVERQSSQPQPSSSSNSGNTSTNNTGRVGQEPGAGGLRNRVGQISHSVVLGTISEQGENVGTDLSRFIGAVLNSIGIGNQPGTQPSVQVSQRSATEGMRNDVGPQSQGGNQPQPGQPFTGQTLPHVMQIPLGAAIALPSINMPIPDSLSTIYEFVNRLEQAMSQHGYLPSQSPNTTGDPEAIQLPSTPRGVPTPEALSIVLQHAQHLLGGQAVAALSHVAGRLEQEAGSNDPTIRGQIHTESVQVGLAMQHLGALLLEIGRTMLTLRMGQSPAESSVNAGPAVYISPSGPNPIMVQPFPLQTSSLFGNSASAPSNPGPFGPVGIGNIARHVNIHIHTGASLSPFVSGVGARPTNAEGTQGEHANGTGSVDPGRSQAQAVRNVNTTTVPSRPAVVAVSGTVEPAVGVSLPPPDFFPMSTVLSEVNSQIRNFVGNIQSEQQALSVQAESSTVQEQAVGAGAGNEDRSNEQNLSSDNGLGKISKPFPGVSNTTTRETQPSCHQPCNSKDIGDTVNPKCEPSSSSVGGSNEPLNTQNVITGEGASSSSQDMDTPGSSSATPLGLGLGGLQPKRRSRQSRSQGKSGDSSLVTSNQREQPRIAGQQVLQSLASLSARSNANIQASRQLSQPAGGVMGTQPAEENANGQFDISSAMSQVLQSPALNGLLAGVSQQTGIGSPNALRNIMEQLTENPAMRNTVGQIAQQIDNHDLGNMFSSLGGGQGGGFDLSRMMQQMMPIVSQALGGIPTGPPPTLAMGADLSDSRSRRDVASTVENSQSEQIDIREVARGLEQQSPPEEIFRSMVENAVHLCEGDNIEENVMNELSSDEGLANEFMEMLRQDISRRLQDGSGP